MKIAFYGSSLLSCYWNGAATYYRGIVRALADLGYETTFFEPDAFDRQQHRDIEPPPWCRVMVYKPDEDGVRRVREAAADADILVKASGVGVNDDALLTGILDHGQPKALRIFWDVDAPATLAELAAQPAAVLRRALPRLDLVLTYGGGDRVTAAYRAFGAAECVPVYNAVDPATHHPAPPDSRYEADLSFLGNRLPDRETRVEAFFLNAASRLPDARFLLGGSGWEDKACPPNVRKLGHVASAAHNAMNASARAILNISREDMAKTGFSPATRVFEVAGAGACLISDAWDGIEFFLQPGREVLVARDGADIADILSALTPEAAKRIGAAALRKVRAEHTYERRAAQLDSLLAARVARCRAGRAA